MSMSSRRRDGLCGICEKPHTRNHSWCGDCSRDREASRVWPETCGRCGASINRKSVYCSKCTKRANSVAGQLCQSARKRARKAGMEASITPDDLHWPTHCPVLGLELDYSPPGQRGHTNQYNQPSLDRWDNTKGYVPGNVFVISFRANNLKRDATIDEMKAVVRYMEHWDEYY